MLDLKSIVCAGFGCIMHLQAMAEEVSDSDNVSYVLDSIHCVAGDDQGLDSSGGQEDWREDTQTKIHQTGSDCNCQVNTADIIIHLP